tara:strand:- start:1318 stop:2472 length:1155 start_codon:yes stop_codon:yes gene_type:complete
MKRKSSKKLINDKKIKLKSFSIKNRINKIFLFFFSIIIIIFIILLVLKEHFSINKLLTDLQKNSEIEIFLNEKSSLKFYPEIILSNPNTKIFHKKSSILINNASLIIKKNYWPFSPFYINLKSPLININGIEFKNTDADIVYDKNFINITKLKSNIIEGSVDLNASIDLQKGRRFLINGKLQNIPLNTLLQKLDITKWDKLRIKFSADNFKISGILGDKEKLIKSLNGEADILGSLYLISTDEERFGAALLSLLVEKIPSISSMSKSIDFILSTFGNTNSAISGSLKINNGLITSENIDIKNEYGKSSIKGSVNLINYDLNGNAFFYKDNKIFAETSILGNIKNPKFIIDGNAINNDNNEIPRDIKKIFEEGISSLVDKLLKIN